MEEFTSILPILTSLHINTLPRITLIPIEANNTHVLRTTIISRENLTKRVQTRNTALCHFFINHLLFERSQLARAISCEFMKVNLVSQSFVIKGTTCRNDIHVMRLSPFSDEVVEFIGEANASFFIHIQYPLVISFILTSKI